jgi:TonB-linked SusC/RagA family outer membrane protein
MRKKQLSIFGLFFLLGSLTYAQTTGLIKDSDGFPEADVEVKIKGSDKTAYTDENGNFNIDAKIGEVLVIKGKEITVTSDNLGDLTSQFVTKVDNIDLGTAVVTGYSTQRKEEVTAAVSVVGGKDLVDTKSPNITNLLQGKVAGLRITSGSGKPGSTASMRLRGRTSISGNQDALWVVDGVIFHGVPIISPTDVETISVLKDAAATSQYGSRGANGVIIVTTKRAKTKGLTVNVDYSSSWNIFNKGKFRLMNSNELYDYYNQLTKMPASEIPSPDIKNKNFDWLENGTQIGEVRDGTLSISSNTESTNLYSTINYYNETGTVKGYEYERLTARINLEQKLSDRLTFKPKINATYTNDEDRQHSLFEMYTNLPWDIPFLPNGKAINPIADYDNGNIKKWYSRDRSNYYYDLQTNYGKSDIFDIQGNLDFSWKISNSLTFESTNNVQYYTSTNMYYEDPKSMGASEYQGSISQGSTRRIVRLFNQMLRYNRKFGLHNLSGYIAYEYSDYDYKNLNGTKRGIIPGSEILNNGANAYSTGGTRNDYAFQGGIAQVNYGYDNRYYAQASFRYDGSSRFGADKRYAPFYAFSAGWNISNEEFLKDSKTFTNLKLRGSYGTVGNVGPAGALYMPFGLYNLGDQYNGVPGIVQGQYKNPNITWEQTVDANVGLDVGLFNRINLVFEAYHKNTNRLLHYISFPNSSGWTGYYDNVGKVNNKGLEFTINASLFNPTSEFQWDVSFNIAKNINRVKELYNNNDIPNGSQRITVGRDINSWYLRKWAGVDPANGSPLWEKVDPTTGEVKTTSNYSEATRQYVGTATPDFNGGFSTTMRYKGFALSADFVYSKGGYAYNSGRGFFDSDGKYYSYHQMVLQDGWSRWTPENRNATHPVLTYNNASNSAETSSRFLEDASFLRMRNIRLGYSFDANQIQKLGLKGLTLYISGDNLWTSTKYTGSDVESVISGDTTTNYPNPKRYTFGVNLTF